MPWQLCLEDVWETLKSKFQEALNVNQHFATQE